MLIIQRRENQSIAIDTGQDIIVITVVGHRGTRVQLGIDAPEHVAVRRAEYYGVKDAT
jgi:carbon storage regulator CsrA